jgi:hypothetical protein
VCLLCTDTHCKRCSSSDAGACTECKQNFWLHNTLNTCVTCGEGMVDYTISSISMCMNCPDNCRTCDYNSGTPLCTFCKHGYQLVDGSTCAVCDESNGKVIIWKSGNTQKCFTCSDTNCLRCGIFDETICLKCQTGFFIPYATRHQANVACVACTISATTNQDGDYCLSSNDCTSNCKKCKNLYECETCDTGYFLTSKNTCQVCPANCNACSFSSGCSQCNSINYFLLDGECFGCSPEGTSASCEDICNDYGLTSLGRN